MYMQFLGVPTVLFVSVVQHCRSIICKKNCYRRSWNHLSHFLCFPGAHRGDPPKKLIITINQKLKNKFINFYYFPFGGHNQDTYLTFSCIYKTETRCLKSILAIIQWGSRQGYGSNCFIGQKKIVLLRNAVTHGFNAKLS